MTRRLIPLYGAVSWSRLDDPTGAPLVVDGRPLTFSDGSVMVICEPDPAATPPTPGSLPRIYPFGEGVIHLPPDAPAP